MGLLSRLGAKFKRANPYSAIISRHLLGRAYKPQVDIASLVKRNRGWVYICVSKKAEARARMNLRLFVVGGTKKRPTKRVERKHLSAHTRKAIRRYNEAGAEVDEITEHPLLDLLNNPNPNDCQFTLFENKSIAEDLAGCAYWWLTFNRLGIPTEIWWLYPQWVRPVISKDGTVRSYEYGSDPFNSIVIPAKETIRFPLPNLEQPHTGMARIRAILPQADAAQGQAESEWAMWDGQARPDYHVTIPGPPNPDRQRKLLNELRSQFGGLKRSGVNPLVTSEQVVIKPLGWPPKDIAVKEFAELNRQTICNAIGIPEGILVVQKSRAEAEEMHRIFREQTLLPASLRDEGILNARLVPFFDPSGKLFLAYDDPIPENRELELKEATDQIDRGMITINEWREEDGWAPVEWGDLPWMDGMKAQPGTEPAVRPSGREPPEELAMPKRHTKQAEDLTPEQDALRAAAEGADRKIGGRASRIIGSYTSTTIALEELGGLFGAEAVDIIHDATGKHIRQYVLRGGVLAGEEVGIIGAFDVTNPHVAEFLKEYPLKFAGHHAETLRTELLEGLTGGERITDLAKRVQTVFGSDKIKGRALKIARTESVRAANRGALEAYKASGVVSGKKWMLAQNPCAWCQQIAANYPGEIPLGDDFADGADSLTAAFALADGTTSRRTLPLGYTADIGGTQAPPLHPHCRCRIAPVLRGQ